MELGSPHLIKSHKCFKTCECIQGFHHVKST